MLDLDSNKTGALRRFTSKETQKHKRNVKKSVKG